MISSSPVTDEGNCVFSKHKNGTARIVETMSSWHNAGRSIAKRPKRSPNVRLTCFIIAGETFDCLAEDLNPFSAGTVFIRQILTYKYDPHINIIKLFLTVVDP